MYLFIITVFFIYLLLLWLYLYCCELYILSNALLYVGI